jgi:protein kinase A
VHQHCHTRCAVCHTPSQDPCYVYFVIELLVGGELFTHLRRMGRLQENEARFYAAR